MPTCHHLQAELTWYCCNGLQACATAASALATSTSGVQFPPEGSRPSSPYCPRTVLVVARPLKIPMVGRMDERTNGQE